MASSSKDSFLSRSGGAYIPPMKLKMMMQQQMADKSGTGYQRLSWEALKKSIHGFVNKVNTSNVAFVIRELLGENLIRGRGLFARSLIQCQTFSPTYTNVFAALVAVVNTKFPAIGELLLRRLIIAFRKGYKRRDKNLCLSSTRFVAHLVNQQVAHELLALEILMLLLEQPTDDSVEVAIAFLKECGARLKLVSPRGLVAITDRLRAILHEAQIDPRTQYMIEVLFAVIKDNFKDHPSVVSELDLVEEGDQYTHLISLEDDISEDRELDVFKYDENFLDNEAKYEEIKREILGDEDEEEAEGGEEEGDEEDGEGEGEEAEGNQAIIDNTEVNMVNLRRTIYLAIQSSLNFEEAAHKLLKMTLKPEQEQELCYMIIDCCAQLRTYEKFYGLLAERFCKLNQKFVEPFERIFKEQYETCHRLELMKLRNVAKVFAHLLFTDAINWSVLSCIVLTEDTTTSSGRIFIKILFQELAEHMGVINLNNRFQDPTLKASFNGIFPTDSPKNIRFAINFFTAIGLGGLTDELRDVLKNQQKPTAQLQQKLDLLAGAGAPTGLPGPPVAVVKQERQEKPVKEDSKKHHHKKKHDEPASDSDEERHKRQTKKSEESRQTSFRVKEEPIVKETSVEEHPRRRRESVSPPRGKKNRWSPLSGSRSRSPPPARKNDRSERGRSDNKPRMSHSPSRSPPPARKSDRFERGETGSRPRRSPSPPSRKEAALREPSRGKRKSVSRSRSRSPPPPRRNYRSQSPFSREEPARRKKESVSPPRGKNRRSPSPVSPARSLSPSSPPPRRNSRFERDRSDARPGRSQSPSTREEPVHQKREEKRRSPGNSDRSDSDSRSPPLPPRKNDRSERVPSGTRPSPPDRRAETTSRGRPYEKEGAPNYPGQPKRPRRKSSSDASSSSSGSSSSSESSSNSEDSSSTSSVSD